MRIFRKETVTPQEELTQEPRPRDPREFLERSGKPIHLFVDSMDGLRVIRSDEASRKNTERALKKLGEISAEQARSI